MSERGPYRQKSGRKKRRRDDALYDVGREVAEAAAAFGRRKATRGTDEQQEVNQQNKTEK